MIQIQWKVVPRGYRDKSLIHYVKTLQSTRTICRMVVSKSAEQVNVKPDSPNICVKCAQVLKGGNINGLLFR